MPKTIEYVGVIHLHSVFSDGSGEVDQIAAIASECELDFLILTDHNTLRARDEGYQKFYDKTYLMVGCEINDKDNKNHYLALGIDKVISTRLPPQEYINKVNEMGGIGFIAHPDEKRNQMKEHPPYPWLDWNCTGFTGIEIWNHMSEWMENLTEENKYQAFMHPLRTIQGPPAETLSRWDQLSLFRKVVGIGGVDAHAHKVNLLGFFEVEVFPYKVLFKSVRTHILLDEKIEISQSPDGIRKAELQILEALKNGRCFVSNYYHGDARGFRFFVKDPAFNTWGQGSEVKLKDNLQFVVRIPGSECVVKLIRNGEVAEIAKSDEAVFELHEPGIYRAEVYKHNKAWIFSNHIRVI